MRDGLTDEQWQAMEDLFPKPAATGRPPANPRQMLEAMIWLNNTGAKWRDLPAELGAWQTVFKHFDRWKKDGTLQAVVTCLTQLAIEKGDFSTKLHIFSDGNGHPLGFHLTGGQVNECTVVDELLMTANGLEESNGHPVAWPVAVSGDKDYRANWIDAYLMHLGIKPVIP